MKRSSLFLAIATLVGATFPSCSEARDEAFWQRQYCEGMKLEEHLPSGGYVDCLSDEHAIEVEWAEHWAEAVGQSLYYAAETERRPGIILLCKDSEGPAEGLCRSYIYRLEYALRFVSTHVDVWTCSIDKDRTLADCFRPQIQSPDRRTQ
jgi:hypothetical protein